MAQMRLTLERQFFVFWRNPLHWTPGSDRAFCIVVKTLDSVQFLRYLTAEPELHSVLRLGNICREFVPKFSRIADPFHRQLRSRLSYVWDKLTKKYRRYTVWEWDQSPIPCGITDFQVSIYCWHRHMQQTDWLCARTRVRNRQASTDRSL